MRVDNVMASSYDCRRPLQGPDQRDFDARKQEANAMWLTLSSAGYFIIVGEGGSTQLLFSPMESTLLFFSKVLSTKLCKKIALAV